MRGGPDSTPVVKLLHLLRKWLKCLRQASMTRKRGAELTGPATNQRPCESCGAATCAAFGCYARIQSFKKLQHARLSSAWDICKAFASYVFGHHRVERRLTNRTKPLNIGDKLMMRFRIFQATLSPYHPTSAFWHPHLQSLVQPVDSICHALCQWWQGTCHLATGQSVYVCKHPVLRPCLQITCYCDF